MLFEVIKDGRSYMATDSISCVYPDAILKSMHSAGYSFKWHDKKIGLKNLIDELRKERR